MKLTVNVQQQREELYGEGVLRQSSPLGDDDSIAQQYGADNGKVLIAIRELMRVFTNQIKVFPELEDIIITDDSSFQVFYRSDTSGCTAYLSSGAIIRYFNFISYALSCYDVLPGFHPILRDQERKFNMADELIEKMMEPKLTSIGGVSDEHGMLSTAIVMSGLLSMVCHEIIHIARNHASMLRPFFISQPDEVRTTISKSRQTEFTNIRLRDYETASFYRAIELEADYHSWPNALERSKILCAILEEYSYTIYDPYELFVIGLYSVHICHSHYEASNLDIDMDLGTTFRTHPTTHNRLLFMRRMLVHLLNNRAFPEEDTSRLMAALDKVVNGFGGCKPYPIPAYDVMQLKDQEIMLKDFENFRKIASI
ncbi:MAG: hypothetical protein AAGF87_16265 [Bacteroidota bacterium]